MSKLYLTESGRVVPTLCEELTAFRRTRKILDLPATSMPATLYVLARPASGGAQPLRVAVNGHELPGISPKAVTAYFWYELPVAASLLHAGPNVFEFWTEAPAMNAWSLALEAGQAEPGSFVSDDGGTTWRNEKMGYLNVVRGEYVVRVRLEEGEDSAPPRMVWEDPAAPRVRRLRELVPPRALSSTDLMDRVRALTAWISSSWEYRHSGDAAQYAPWDAETILAWGGAKSGHNGQLPIVMCVHYAVVFVSCCQAIGIPARCAALTGGLSSFDGHFVAEVWFDESAKWVMVDPNLDTIFYGDGVPLSIEEIQQEGHHLDELIDWGPGRTFQLSKPAMVEWVRNTYVTGRCFRYRSLWPRTDFLSHPELTPPGHGTTAYCETDLVWEERCRAEGFGMFPCFAGTGYFNAPPQFPS